MAVAAPATGSLTKISAGAPVYIGEQGLDISSGLQGCHILEWWANGTDTSAPPTKNVTIMKSVEDSDVAFHYSIDPGIYSGSFGRWYCEDKKPLRAVFEVMQPQLAISIWDLDKNEDITGKTVSLNTNITYHIDTNLDRALQIKYRPDITPQDSFFTITLTDPRGNVLQSLYSGSFGKADTHVFTFENKPFISTSPYIWKDGEKWDRGSRNAQGDLLYPAGTYTLTVKQNLNRMDAIYATSPPETRTGLIEATAAVTLIKPESAPVQAVTTRGAVPSGASTTSPADIPKSALTYETMPSTQATVPAKTTYAPLPFWVVLPALGIALAYAGRQKK